MPASEARVAANRLNAQKSTGPKTEEGKSRSRANAFKHGLTGEGVVLPEEDAAEVERLAQAFGEELRAEGEVGHALARRLATMSVRMDRCAAHEAAALSDRVRRAIDSFEPPEGCDPGEAERLRDVAGRLALFDPSKEATLARKYEAAAERCFFRTLKELRQPKVRPASSPAAAEAAEARASLARLGSFLPAAAPAPSKPPAAPSQALPTPSKPAPAGWDPFAPAHFDVPIAIGRAR